MVALGPPDSPGGQPYRDLSHFIFDTRPGIYLASVPGLAKFTMGDTITMVKRKPKKDNRSLLDRFRRKDTSKDLDFNRCSVLLIRGKMASLRDGVLDNRTLKIPSMNQTYLMTTDKESDLDTVYLRHDRQVSPIFVVWEDQPTFYPINQHEIVEVDGSRKIRFSVEGKIDNELLDLYFDKSVAREVYRAKADWVTTITVTTIVALNEYAILKGDSIGWKEQVVIMVIFSCMIGFLVIWNNYR